MTVGQAVKVMRTASGLKQKEVASRLRVTVNYLSLIENGKREPSISFLRALASVLGVPIGLFFLWDESDARSSKADFRQLRTMLTQLESMYLVASRRNRERKAAS